MTKSTMWRKVSLRARIDDICVGGQTWAEPKKARGADCLFAWKVVKRRADIASPVCARLRKISK